MVERPHRTYPKREGSLLIEYRPLKKKLRNTVFPSVNRQLSDQQRSQAIDEFALGAAPRDVAQQFGITVEHATRLAFFHEQAIKDQAKAFDASAAEQEVSEPVSRALGVLSTRATHQSGRFTLDGRPADAMALVRAANRLLRMRKKPAIPYPGLEA